MRWRETWDTGLKRQAEFLAHQRRVVASLSDTHSKLYTAVERVDVTDPGIMLRGCLGSSLKDGVSHKIFGP